MTHPKLFALLLLPSLIACDDPPTGRCATDAGLFVNEASLAMALEIEATAACSTLVLDVPDAIMGYCASSTQENGGLLRVTGATGRRTSLTIGGAASTTNCLWTVVEDSCHISRCDENVCGTASTSDEFTVMLEASDEDRLFFLSPGTVTVTACLLP